MLGNLLRFVRGRGNAAQERAASVFERDGQLLFHPLDKTTAGIWRYAEPVLVSSRDSPEEAVSHLRTVLRASRPLVEHDLSGWSLAEMKALVAAAKVRSYKAFVAGAKLVNVRQRGTTLIFTPTSNLGRKEGWEEIRGRDLMVDIESGEIFAALSTTLDASAA